MSGFCGIFFRGGRPATADDLAPAMDALAHHGRDGHGVWYGGAVAFGHQMLHVTPESMSETLPCYQTTPPLAITGDFRLDNRAELLAALSVPRELWPATPDSTIILLAYERWGTVCVDHLLGDFAFAIWDETEQHLFCARDFIGAKPFYYYGTSDGWYFSSDIAALMTFPAVSDKLDLRYVRSYLELGRYYHLEYSFYEDVRKLPPGHKLIVSADGSRKESYWSAAKSPLIRYKQDEEYFAHLRALLDEAVGARLRSAYPVGSHLSGGLDSSSVAVLAARALRERGETPHGFSWSPPPHASDFPLTDERALVQAICEAEEMLPVYTPRQVEDRVAHMMRDITRYPEHTLIFEVTTSRIAEAMGKRVMLSGWGGDEGPAFNGRGYFADLFRRGRWLTMTRELALRTRLHEDDFWGSLRSRAVLPLLPDGVVARLRPDLLKENQRAPLPLDMLQPAFAAQLQAVEPYPSFSLRERPGARAYQIKLLQYGHLANRLESWAENGGQRGLEYRFPLLDRRVIEFALGVPERLYHYHGWKRYLFRETAAGILPAEVRWLKSKGEPALIRPNPELVEQTDRLLQDAMNKRRSTIQQAGYLEDEGFFEGLRSPQGEELPTNHAWRVLWLAQLG